MDGSMWYANGGGGIFQHVDGPFAKPCQDPVVTHLGFEGLGAVRPKSTRKLGCRGCKGLGADEGGDGATPAEAGIPIPIAASPATIDDLVGASLAEQGLSFSKEGAPSPAAGAWPMWAKVTLGVGAASLAMIGLSVALRRR